MRLKNIDLMAVIVVVVVNVVYIQLPYRPWPIGVMLALPLIFALPGYALTQALFVRSLSETEDTLILQPRLKLGQPVGVVDHITLGLGLSMAVAVLVGFTLNVLPVGLQAQSWTLSLAIITIVFTLAAAFRRRGDQGQHERITKTRIALYEYILFGLSIVIAAIAIFAAIIRPPGTQNFYTQFWMLPAQQTTTSCAVRVGVQNFEQTSTNYRITITANEVPVNTWSSVTLAPKEEWDHVVTVPIVSTKSIYVEAKLYKADSSGIYRTVHMTLNAGSGGSKDAKAQC